MENTYAVTLTECELDDILFGLSWLEDHARYSYELDDYHLTDNDGKKITSKRYAAQLRKLSSKLEAL